MLTFIPDRPRIVAAMSWAVLLGLGFEMALIVMQVLRNTTSHFNVATSSDAAVFRSMGAAITGIWLLTAIVGFLLARRRFAEAPTVWGVRLGLIAGLLGMMVAFLMIRPTPDQAAQLAAGPLLGGVTLSNGVRIRVGGTGCP